MAGAVLVTGGTGTLGRHVVRRLLDGGREVRVLSRRAGSDRSPVPPDGRFSRHVGDLATGAGLAAALTGVDTVLHCASDQRNHTSDIDGIRRLVDACRTAGVRHLVVVSIVGIDRIPLGYYRTKLAVERVVAESQLGWTILRATQFHELVLTMVNGLTRLPVALVPAGISFQPIDPDEVAERLVTLSAGPPAGRAADLGGPEVRSMIDLTRAYLRVRGKRRLVAAVWLPGALVRALRSGANLTPDHADGRRTWEQFLRTAR